MAACTGQIGCIAVDGIAELQRLAEISRNRHTATVMLRLNVGVEASTHAFVRTGGKDSKFGIHPRDENEAAELLLANPQLHFTGVHAHIGSQIYDESAYLENATALVAAAQRFASSGLQSQRIVIGGGFGVPSDPDGEQRTAQRRRDRRRRGGARSQRGGGTWPRQGCGRDRTRTSDRRRRRYDALSRPRRQVPIASHLHSRRRRHRRKPAPGTLRRTLPRDTVTPRHEEDQEITLCGRSCENDELGTMRLPRDVAPGDLLAMHSTGAYTYSMAGNYNRFPKPAVVGHRKRHPPVASAPRNHRRRPPQRRRLEAVGLVAHVMLRRLCTTSGARIAERGGMQSELSTDAERQRPLSIP